MSADDQAKLPSSSPAGGEDDLIELTEVVEESPAEVVLDFRPGQDDLDSLKSPPPSPEEKLEPSSPEAEESLNDFLASLPDLPEDLDLPAQEPPPATRVPDRDLGQELAERLDEAELKDLVLRQVVQETVERLAREVLPEMAAAAFEREFRLLKKRLTDTD